MSDKLISKETEWARVSKELEAEKIKLAYYDNTLIPLLGNLKGKKVLDYGGGPGILATALKKLGAQVKEYDISPDMRKQAGDKIGVGNIYENINKIPKKYFDFVICNLVLCIVSETEVKRILTNIKNVLKKEGLAYIGFCNPLIYDVPESRIDFRKQTGEDYNKNHNYQKVKKEGGYRIVEIHRPIEWYESVYRKAGLKLTDIIFTPEYELKGRIIKDFAIFKLKK